MKFDGVIGFWEEDIRTDSPDVWVPHIIEKKYQGDVCRNARRFQNSSNQYGNFTISNQISVIADLDMQKNWSSIRYVLWNGVKWKVTNVDVNFPRITLELGGVWNENEESQTSQIKQKTPWGL